MIATYSVGGKLPVSEKLHLRNETVIHVPPALSVAPSTSILSSGRSKIKDKLNMKTDLV